MEEVSVISVHARRRRCRRCNRRYTVYTEIPDCGTSLRCGDCVAVDLVERAAEFRAEADALAGLVRAIERHRPMRGRWAARQAPPVAAD